jgi:large repetitive protein
MFARHRLALAAAAVASLLVTSAASALPLDFGPFESGQAAPTLTITGAPPALSNAVSATFTFTASEQTATFQCKLDTGAFAACTSPQTYSGLAQGQHTFTIQATDASGTGEASHTWTIDTVAPVAAITEKPGDPSKVNTANFAFGASEAATFQCALDGAAFESCTSPKAYPGLADGQHTFQVKATDQAGNSGAAAAYTWRIDTKVPTTTITKAPSNPSKEAVASFEFRASETRVTFQCKLDSGAFGSCGSPKTYSGLGAGPHTFEVKATDQGGNAGPPASYAWTIDLTDPTVTITVKPSNPSNVASPSFEFAASEPSTFRCKLDAGAFAACTSPKPYTGLANGSHTFTVEATDTAKNVGNAAYTWTIDTVPPAAPVITGKPSSSSNTRSASFSFTATGGTLCRIDAAAPAPCTSPVSYNELSDGPHTFGVRAGDQAGNVSAEATYAWTIETRAPTAALVSTPSGLSNSSAATFAFGADEPSSFDCKLDNGGFDPCTSPATYHGLGDGAHAFIVRARDAVGNFSPPVSHSWSIDTTAPETRLASAPQSGTATTATFTFSASEGGTFECRLDGAPFALCGSPKSYTGLSRGDHRFEVRAIDAAGNADTTPALHAWKVTAPAAKKTTSALLSPRAGARVTRPPLLVWRRHARARYYNVQIYRGSRKVFSSWPTRTRLQLRAQWKYLGRKRRLVRGTYRWYVWPGLGPPSARNYGALLGQSTFIVRRGK